VQRKPNHLTERSDSHTGDPWELLLFLDGKLSASDRTGRRA